MGLQAFFRKYQYKHTAVCFAVDEVKNIVFSLAVDSEVQPKEGVFTKLDDKETAESRCISTRSALLLFIMHRTTLCLKEVRQPELLVVCHLFKPADNLHSLARMLHVYAL